MTVPDAQGHQSFLRRKAAVLGPGLQKSPTRSHTETSRELLCKPDVHEPKHRQKQDQRGYLTQLRIKGRLRFV